MKLTKEKLKKQMRLYAITDNVGEFSPSNILSKVICAIEGGATAIQLREKRLNITCNDLILVGLYIKDICKKKNVLFIIDDNVELCLKIGADGVHLGQHDMSVDKARKILGADFIIGSSARTVENAILQQKLGADYLGCGAVFATSSKKDAIPLNKDILQNICTAVNIPVVAIGGITKDNVELLKGTGIAGIAAISSIFLEDDIKKATNILRRKVDNIVL